MWNEKHEQRVRVGTQIVQCLGKKQSKYKKQACYDRNVSLRWESGVKKVVRHKRSWENVLESPLDSSLIRGHLEYILGVQAYEWQKRGGICCGLNVKYLPYVLCT